MKNSTITKRLIFLFITILFVAGCSKDEPSGNDPNDSSFRFISSIIANPTEPRDSLYDDIDTLVYKDGRPFKVLLGVGCFPFPIKQYEYGDNGKVSVIYRGNFNPYYEGSNEYEEMISRFENSNLNETYDSKTKIEYNSDNKIKKIYTVDKNGNSQPFMPFIEYKYDDENRLYKVIFPSQQTIRTVTAFDDKDQPITVQTNYDGDISEISYEYGELKNPFYALYQKYGIARFDDNCIFKADFITPYVMEIKQSSSSNQFYNYTSSDGEYPETMTYDNYHGTIVYKFQYR